MKITDKRMQIIILQEQKRNLLALLFFVLLTTIAAWPVLTNLDSVIIGHDNDVYINPWADWWTQKALTDPTISIWYTDFIFYPYGANLVYHSFSHFNTGFSLLLRPLLGTLPAYNIAILLNYVLAGLAMFQMAYYLTKSTAASLLAGIVFAFNSHNLYQSAHPVLVSVWCLPWLTLSFFHAVEKNSLKWAVLTAVIVALGALASTLFLSLMGLWMILLVGYMFLSSQFPRPSWRVLAVVAGLSTLFVLPLIFPLLQDALLSQNTTFSQNARESIVTDPFAMLVPHWLFWEERSMYIGFLVLTLVYFALRHRARQSLLWLLLAILAFLFAIGPYPVVAGLRLDIVLPWSFLITPTIRNPYRMMILFSMGIALLVAYGWTVLEGVIQSRRNQQIAAVIAMFVVFLDYTAVRFPTTPATVSPFYTDFLDVVPDDVVLATVPYGRQEDKRYLFYQTFHGHPITGGVISRADEPTELIESNAVLRAGMARSDAAPLPDNWEKSFSDLAEAGIGYLVLDKNLLEDVATWQAQIPFDPVYEDDLVTVYAVEE